jgi:predicted oxidoreductase (fatty acid repression mutant protein)
LQYTIEVRELTNPTSYDGQSLRTVVMAEDADEAIHQYVRDRAAELVSFTHPARGRESIATVKKEDAMFLVRVYAA